MIIETARNKSSETLRVERQGNVFCVTGLLRRKFADRAHQEEARAIMYALAEADKHETESALRLAKAELRVWPWLSAISHTDDMSYARQVAANVRHKLDAAKQRPA